MTLGVRSGSIDATAIGSLGASAMGRLDMDAELWVGSVRGEARTVGALQRCPAAIRRASCGGVVDVGPGTLHVLLALSHPAALVPCTPAQLLNRYVRPLLSALTGKKKASYFGRDWISMGHRPVGFIGFAHRASSGRTLIEALCAVSTPFVRDEHVHRATFLGKEPSTLEAASGHAVDLEVLKAKVVRAYAEAYAVPTRGLPDLPAPPSPQLDEPPWLSSGTEVIGQVAAGPDRDGVFRVGGDFLASADAVAELEMRLARGDDVSRALDDTLAAPGVALEGIRSLTSLRDVITRAKSALATSR